MKEVEFSRIKVDEQGSRGNIAQSLNILERGVKELFTQDPIKQNLWKRLMPEEKKKVRRQLEKSIWQKINSKGKEARFTNEPSEAADRITTQLTDFLTNRGVKIMHRDILDVHVDGVYYHASKTILIKSSFIGEARAGILAHETGHHLGGHMSVSPTETECNEYDKQEAVAESFAFVVMQNFGFNRSFFSFPHVARHLYSFNSCGFPEIEYLQIRHTTFELANQFLGAIDLGI